MLKNRGMQEAHSTNKLDYAIKQCTAKQEVCDCTTINALNEHITFRKWPSSLIAHETY